MADQGKFAKEKQAAFNAKREVLARQWHVFNVPDAAAAVAWLNTAPAQQAGEAFVGAGPNGTVDAYAFF